MAITLNNYKVAAISAIPLVGISQPILADRMVKEMLDGQELMPDTATKLKKVKAKLWAMQLSGCVIAAGAAYIASHLALAAIIKASALGIAILIGVGLSVGSCGIAVLVILLLFALYHLYSHCTTPVENDDSLKASSQFSVSEKHSETANSQFSVSKEHPVGASNKVDEVDEVEDLYGN